MCQNGRNPRQTNMLLNPKPHRRRSDETSAKILRAAIPVLTAALGWLAAYIQNRGGR